MVGEPCYEICEKCGENTASPEWVYSYSLCTRVPLCRDCFEETSGEDIYPEQEGDFS